MASRRVAKGHEIILRPEPSRKICWLTPPAGGPSSPFRPRSKIFDESGRDFGGPRRGDGPRWRSGNDRQVEVPAFLCAGKASGFASTE